MKVFISHTLQDQNIVDSLSEEFSKREIDVVTHGLYGFAVFSIDLAKVIDEIINDVDAVLLLITPGYNKNDSAQNETRIIKAHMLSMEDNKRPLFLPIVIGKDTPVSADIRGNYVLQKDQADVESILDIIAYTEGLLLRREARLEKEKREKQEQEEKVKTSLSAYIEPSLSELKRNSTKNKRISYICYFLSACMIIMPIVFVSTGISSLMLYSYNNYISLIILLFSRLILILLFIAASRFFFVLAKSFMTESIRNSDRLHAISFGKFFLDAFGQQASMEEILQAFGSWNIDTGSTFKEMSAEDVDPKLIEIAKILRDLVK